MPPQLQAPETAQASATSPATEEREATTTNNDDSLTNEERRLEELYQAAKDENELLEFKNYELLFKIQELEQNQRKIQNKLDSVVARTPEEALLAGQSGVTQPPIRLTQNPSATPTTNLPAPVKVGADSAAWSAAEEQHNSLIDGASATIMNDGQGASSVKLGQQVALEVLVESCSEANPTEATATSGAARRDHWKLVAPKASTGAQQAGCDGANSNSVQSKPFNGSSPVKSAIADHLGHENMDDAQPTDYSLGARKAHKSQIRGLHDTLYLQSAPPKQQVTSGTTRAGQQVICGVGGPAESGQLIEYNGRQQPASRSDGAAAVSSPESCSSWQQQVLSVGGFNGSGSPTLTSAGPAKVMSTLEDEPARVTLNGLSPPTGALASNQVGESAEAGITASSPVSSELADEQQHQSASSSDKTTQPKQHSSTMVTPANRKLGQEAKKLAQSQPNLSKQQVAPRRPVAARIAVPVARSSLQAGKPEEHRSLRGASSGLNKVPPAAANYLRVRSKSSLDQSSCSTSTQLRQAIARSARRAPSKLAINKQSAPQLVSEAGDSNHEPFSKAPGTVLRAPGTGIPLASAQSGRHKSRSASSMGFVTQIPTLMSPAYAPNTSPSIGTPVAAEPAGRRARPALRPLADTSADHSRSMSSLPSSEAQTGVEGGADSVAHDGSLGAAERTFAKTSPSRHSSLSTTPAAIKGNSASKSCVSLIDKSELADDHQADEAASAAASGIERSMPSLSIGDSRDPANLPTAMQPSYTVVSDQRTDGQHQSVAANLEQDNNSLRECAQCKLLQSKLNLLIMDRKQLSEQINELEEMENDSRLMSQKLGQQLLSVEQQLEGCKSELQSAHDNESRLQFQNKRLSFELQQLQGQLELVGQQQQSVAGSPSRRQQHRDEIVERNNGIDLTRNERRQFKSAAPDPRSTAQSEDRSPRQQSEANESAARRRPSAELEPASEEPSGLPVAPSVSNSDDDSAIDVFDKREPPSCASEKPAGHSVDQPESLGDTQKTAGGEDSAYSKSSASSDANSDDGRCEQPSSSVDLLIDLGDAQVSVEGHQIATETQKEADSQPVHIASSSSSGDESDYHDTGATLRPSSESTLPAAEQLSTQQVGSSPAAALTGRQQVLRKKISTARILRGIQVQPAPVVANKTQLPSAVQQQRNDDQHQQQTDQQARARPLISQAILAQVVSELNNGACSHQDTQRAAPADKDQLAINDNSVADQNLTQQTSGKSPIELALEGVEKLEQGHTDEALRSLVRSSKSRQIDGQIVQPPLPPTRPRLLDTEVANMMEQFKKEIAALKTRLIQTQTLNDNLVAELKSNNARQQQQPYIPRASHLANHSRQPLTVESAAELEMQSESTFANKEEPSLQPKQRSVVYLNGVRTSVTHHQTTLISGSASAIAAAAANAAATATTRTGNSEANNKPVHQYRDNNRQTACISLLEFVEFLKLLLDKIHFHHERTFELVNESHKLSMNALLASYSHKMNLVHHNSAVLAGNQASCRNLPAEVGVEHHRQQQLLKQESACELYPVRPPPRRRNALNRTNSDHQFSNDGSEEPTKCFEQRRQQPQPQQQHTASNGRNSTSALQVAKQTLFSIVPIHYSSGSSGHKNNKEKSANKGGTDNAKIENNYKLALNDAKQPTCTSNLTAKPNKSKSWILLNHKSTESDQIEQEETDYINLQHQTHSYGHKQQQNVSVLEISRSNDSSTNIYAQPDQLVYQSQPHVNQPLANAIAAQQLARVRNSLSEDIERYRVRFNGQLLDLLTRQNWCESIIAEKLKVYQSFQQSNRTIHRADDSCFHTMDSTGAKSANNALRSTNLPINSICLNPNGLSQQQLARQQKSHISLREDKSASFC